MLTRLPRRAEGATGHPSPFDLRAGHRPYGGGELLTLVFPLTDRAAGLFGLDRAPEGAGKIGAARLRCDPSE